MQPIRVLLIDDHVPMREHVAALLSTETDIQVVAAAGSAEEALDVEKEIHPDVVIMDIMLPGMNGVEAIRRMVSRSPDAKILALSNHSGAALIQAVFDAGGLGYVRKNHAAEELIPAIRTVGAGEKYICTGSR